MQKPLAGRRVAILVGNGFEEMQMTDCQRALLAAGAAVKIVSTANGLVNGWHGKSWGHYHPVDQQVAETLAADFDMLLLPSGERSLAKLLETAHTTRIIRGFRDASKPVAAIGTGIDLLKAAERAADIEIASDETLIVSGSVLTATDAVDMTQFTAAMIELFANGEQLIQTAA